MHILFIADSNIRCASFRHRVHQYIRALEAEGNVCEVARPESMRLRGMAALRQYDVVFLQKRLMSVPWVVAASHFARRMVFDFDDAIWTCPRRNWSPATRIQVSLRLRTILRRSSCAIAGNSYLAEYAGRYNRNVVVIPTCVNTDYYRPLPQRLETEGVRIGWVGSKPNLMYLEQIEPVFRRLPSGSRPSLVVIADREYHSPNLTSHSVPWSLETELEDLRRIDIGVMPLPDNEWTRGKCGFKTIQFMACGIPSVSSRVGFNNDLVLDGRNGFLASDEDEWVERLTRLLEDPELRLRIGHEGRRIVAERYSLKTGAGLLADTLRNACSTL